MGGSFQNYMLFLLSINSAKKSILITNPYFIPDDVMTEALVKAAGVRVSILLPGEPDSQLNSGKSYRDIVRAVQLQSSRYHG
jgi:phosphatidylserine/phosphatidylglycerophosphate/cardiolipin synthase-like enzyme